MRNPTDTAGALSSLERDILAFEHQPYATLGAKYNAIHARFGVTPTRYFQQLNALINRPEALAADPLLVNRLRRIRDTHRARATARPRTRLSA